MKKDVSVIIVNFKTPDLTIDALNAVCSVMDSSNYSYEIIIVDNFSNDGSFEKIGKVSRENIFVFETPKNGGFSYGNNFGVEKSSGKYLFFLNSDTILQPKALIEMIDLMEQDKSIGAMSCYMIDADDKYLVTGHKFENVKTLFKQTVIKPLLPRWIKDKYASNIVGENCGDRIVEYDWVSGAGLLVPRNIFEEIGGWNEVFFMYMEDEELCYRIGNLGKRIGVYPKLGIRHLVGKSGGSSFVAYERYRSKIKYFELTKAHPMWLIRQLLFLQTKQYMSGLDKVERKKVIQKLKRKNSN